MELSERAAPCRAAEAMTWPTLMEAARRLRAGDVAAEDYARDLMDRGERASGLNAFISLDRTALSQAARLKDEQRRAGRHLGSLHGIPIAFKDNINTASLPTTVGTPALEGFRPQFDAPVAQRLFEAGALLLGKTNMHELSMGWTGNNPRFGAARNPYDHARLCGGSSSGTACAVAAGLAPAGLGTDTNGSLRIPASFCGIASLRPSTGRYPIRGVAPLSHTLDAVGPMARCVADLAQLDAVMAGAQSAQPREGLSGVRLGLASGYFLEGASPAVAAAVERALDRLARAGAEVVRLSLPDLDRLVAGSVVTIIHFEAARLLPAYLEAFGAARTLSNVAASAGPDVREILTERLLANAPRPVEEKTYLEALERRRALRALLARTFREHDLSALAYPAARVTAPLVSGRFISPAPDFDEAGFRLEAREAFGKNVAPSALAGWPSLVLPSGANDELMPVGVEFMAPEGRDTALLSLGFALEAALGPRGEPSAAASCREPALARAH